MKYRFLIIFHLAIILILSSSVALASTTIGTNISTGGTLTANGALQFTSGASNSYILSTDGSGNATWVSVGNALIGGGLGVGNLNGIAPLNGSSQVPMSNLPVGVPNGVASLDGTGMVPSFELPAIAITDTWVINSQASMLALAAHQGDVAVRTDINESFILAASDPTILSNWVQLLFPLGTALLPVNNLSDVTSKPASRTNLGLGTGDTPTFNGLDITTYEDFTPGASPSYSEGRLFYDSSRGALAYYNSVSGIQMDIGQRNVVRVDNPSGSPIPAGSVVYVTGASPDGDLNVDLAKADAETTSKVLGIASITIPAGGEGFVTTNGIIYNENTATFSDGDTVYLSPTTAGGLTAVKPLLPNYEVPIGFIGKSSATVGSIYILVGTKISSLLATGEVPFGSTNGFLNGDTANLFWDNTNKRLGIGTNLPNYALDVNGTIKSGNGSLVIFGSKINPDPSGVNGAMYYNTSTNRFRCYENSAWKNCDTTGATTTLQTAYSNGASISTVGSTDIAYTLDSGNFTASGAGSVYLTPTGASSFTSGASLTITAGADSTWSTSAGALTIDSAAALNLGTTNASSIILSKAGGASITLANLNSAGIVHTNGSGLLSTSALNLASDVSGTLPIVNGGTNSNATPTAGGISYGTGTAYAFTPAGSSGQVLQSNGTGTPTWVTPGYLSSAITSLNGLTTATQFFANDTNVTITSSGSTHTLGWTGTLSPTRGGTGVNNGSNTITLGGNFTTSGANDLTLTTSGPTSLTLPTSGTLFTNPMNTLGDIIYGGASGVPTKLAGSAGFLKSTGAATPTWSLVNLSSDTTGTLGIANGGTGATTAPLARAALGAAASGANSDITSLSGLTTLLSISQGGTNSNATPTAGGISYGTGTAYAFTPAGSSGQVLQSNGTGTPTWVTPGYLSSAITSLNGLTTATQFFANDTNVTITSSGSTHTLGWTGTLSPTRGGTGVNNGSNTITLGGNFTTSGANDLTLTTSGPTSLTLPTSGTLFTNPMNTLGDIIYGGASGVPTKLAGSAGFLKSTGAATPTWSLVNLSSDTTGTLGIANGGTNQTTYTTGDMLYASASNVLSTRTIGNAGDILTVVGGVPTWAAPATGSSSFASLTTGTNVAAIMTVGTGASLAATGTGTITATAAPASGLTGTTLAAGVTGSSLTSVATLTAGVWNATAIDATHGGTNQTTYTTGDMLYASASNVLSTRTIGNAGDILTVVGGVPTWAAPATGSSSFASLTTGTNVAAIMTVGTGASLAATGTGTITATAAPASGLTGTTLAAGVTGSSLTSVATLTAGVWNATAIDATHGGTGLTSLTQYAIPYATSTSAFGQLPIGSANQVLAVNGTANGYTWTTLSSVSGTGTAGYNTYWTGTNTLGSEQYTAVSRGGTGLGSYTQYGLLYAPTAGTIGQLGLGTTTTVLHGNASGAPTWSAIALGTDTTGTLGIANGGTGATTAPLARAALGAAASGANSDITSLSGLTTLLSISQGGTNSNATPTAGGISYGTGTAYAFTPAGSSGQVLQSNGTGTPTWVTPGYLSSAITSLNGLTTATQFFANDTNVTITSSGSTHTLGWTGTLSPTRGGTGVNNGSNTITVGGNFNTGANALTFTTSGPTSLTLPTSGTLFTNPMNTLGDIIYGGASGVPTRLAGSAGFLKSTGAATPTWSLVSLSSDTTGTLGIANGGTGATTAPLARAALGAAASGANSDITSLSGLTTALGPIYGGTGLAAYTTGDMLYASATNTLSKLAVGTNGQCLTSNGTTPTWGSCIAGLTLQTAYNGGNTITTSSSHDIAFTLTSGNFTASGAGSVNLTPTGASSFTSSGVLTLTAGAASTWGTTSGDLTLQAAGAGTTANIKIGAGGAGSTTPDILALDVKSTDGDPAGYPGAMYYNAAHETTGRFRCYEAGAWVDCGTNAPSSTSLQSAYTNGSTITTASNNAITFAAPGGSSNAALVLQQNNSLAPVLQLTNAGTANDITATNWSITKAGNLSTSGNLTTTGSGIITSAGTLTALNGFTMSTGALSMTATSGSLTLSGLSASSISTGANSLSLAGSPLNLNTTGTGNTAIGNASGTFALTSSGGLNVTTGGALTGVASIDTIAHSATAITFAAGGTISTTGANDLTIDSGTTGAVNLGTGANAKTITIGSSSSTAVKIGKLGTQYGILYTSATDGTLAQVAAGTAGQVLQSNDGTGAPTWGSGITGSNYAMAYDTTTQSSTTSWAAINFNTNSPQLNGWTHTAGTSNFTCNQTGLYLVNYTAETYKNGGSAGENMEFRAYNTTTSTVITGSVVGETVYTSLSRDIAVTFIMSMTAGQTFQLQYVGTNGGGAVDRIVPITVAGQTTPSIIMSIMRMQ